MAYVTPSKEPAQLRAGDSISWLKSLPDYPASEGWVLTYVLINAGQRYALEPAVASGADHLVRVPAATSAAWVAGRYSLVGRVTLAGEAPQTITIGQWPLEVLPDLLQAADTRSTARRLLEAIESFLLNKDPTVGELQYNGRAIKHIPIGDLLKARSLLQTECKAEEAKARIARGLPARNKIQVRL